MLCLDNRSEFASFEPGKLLFREGSRAILNGSSRSISAALVQVLLVGYVPKVKIAARNLARRQQALRLVGQGLPITDVARQMGLSPFGVRKILHKALASESVYPNTLGPEQVAELRQLEELKDKTLSLGQGMASAVWSWQLLRRGLATNRRTLLLRGSAFFSSSSTTFGYTRMGKPPRASIRFERSSNLLLFLNWGFQVGPEDSLMIRVCFMNAGDACLSESPAKRKRYRAFLCYNGADKALVKPLAEEGEKRGLSCWPDKRNLIPRDPWQHHIGVAVGTGCQRTTL